MSPTTRLAVGPLRVLLYPLRTSAFGRPLLRIPVEENVFLLDVLSNARPDDVPKMVDANRTLHERARQLGGTLYPISAVPMSPTDWREHYGPEWPNLAEARGRFDPDGVFTPAPGVS